MPNFESFDGLRLFYHDEGDGRTVVLLHGFAADTNVNYVRSGILDLLLDEGYRVVTLDARGHGLSSKPTDSAAYADDAMKRDVVALFDHLGLDDVLLVGYSMGAHLALRLAPDEPRVQGGRAARHRRARDRRRGRRRPTRRAGRGARGRLARRRRRRVAPPVPGDGRPRPRAAARLREGAGHRSARPALDGVDVPVLLVVGDDDENAGDPAPLAERLGATLVRVPGDHFTANSRPSCTGRSPSSSAEQ